jgi:hypothetical protein
MHSRIKPYKKTVITELAEAISSFDIPRVEGILSDDGIFAIQTEHYEVVLSDKKKFLDWLNGCFVKFLFEAKSRRIITFNIVQCMHCATGNPIILFEEGRFPVFSGNQLKEEKSGLLIRSDENKVTGIEFCFLVMKTENPFIYERRYLRPDL